MPSEESGSVSQRYTDDLHADLVAVRALLNDGRPLQALSVVNDAIDRLEEENDD